MSEHKQKGKISRFFNQLDIFSDAIYLNVRGKRSLSTGIGGFFSILLIGIVIAQAISLTELMYSRAQPQITQITEIENVPTAIFLNQENNFIFAIDTTLNGKSVYLNQSLVNVSATFNNYVRIGNGSRVKEINSIELAPCNVSNFEAPLNQEIYNNYTLNTALCPTTDNFEIYGSYLNAEFGFLQFTITPCNNSEVPIGVVCANQENIESAFANGQIKINFYYSNTNFNPLTYPDPNSTFFDNIYWELSAELNKASDIFMDIDTYQDFDGYISSTYNHNSTYYSINPSNERDQQTYTSDPLNNMTFPLLQFNLRRSNYNLITSRIYSKIPDILANLGGFSKSIMFAFAFIAAGYARYKYQMLISNELYDFDLGDSSNSDNSKPKTRNSEPTNKSPLLQSRDDLIKSEKKDDGTIRNELEEYLKTRKKLKFNSKSYFRDLLCCCCNRRDKHKELSAKAIKRVDEDIDILQILQKLKEIDKIKMIVMNHHQREIFNFTPKPVLSSDERAPEASEGMRISAVTELEGEPPLARYGRLYRAYQYLKSDDNIENKELNQKLISMLGRKLVEFFNKVEQEIGEDPRGDKFDELMGRAIQNNEKSFLSSLSDQ